MTSVSGEAVFDRVAELRGLIGELEPILQSLMMNDSTIIDGLAQMLGTLQHMQARTEAHVAGLAADLRELSRAVEALQTRSDSFSTAARIESADPEIELLAHLLPTLPNPVLIDVGANVGRLAAELVDRGFEVHAFEPFRESFAALERVADASGGRLHAHRLAIGGKDAEAELYVAEDRTGAAKWDTSLFHSTMRHPLGTDLGFGRSETVPMRTLATLARDGAIPTDAAVLKIDTEGADLAVIEGAGETGFPVVLTEFWDGAHPFGREGHGDPGRLVSVMRERGYAWHIMLFRVDETGEQGYASNVRVAPPTSWGNLVFFADFALFRAAASWCAGAFAAERRSPSIQS